jgi:hypothetical protein
MSNILYLQRAILGDGNDTFFTTSGSGAILGLNDAYIGEDKVGGVARGPKLSSVGADSVEYREQHVIYTFRNATGSITIDQLADIPEYDNFEMLVIGKGGNGGSGPGNTRAGGGGGGGEVVHIINGKFSELTTDTPYEIVPAGGIYPSSSAFGYIAINGGTGGTATSTNPTTGGSGGGGYDNFSSGVPGATAATSSQAGGLTGEVFKDLAGAGYRSNGVSPGGGGGAGATDVDPATDTSLNGGAGYKIDFILTGSLQEYGRGGNAGTWNSSDGSLIGKGGDGTYGGDPTPPTGPTNGAVIIRIYDPTYQL